MYQNKQNSDQATPEKKEKNYYSPTLHGNQFLFIIFSRKVCLLPKLIFLKLRCARGAIFTPSGVTQK